MWQITTNYDNETQADHDDRIPRHDGVLPICQFFCLFNTERIISSSLSISIGFAICPFIPAAIAC